MKFLKTLLPILVATCGISSNLVAREWSSRDEITERDWEAVTDFVKSKRALTVEEKGGNFSISGDVRFEWENYSEKHEGVRQRGSTAQRSRLWYGGHRVPNDQFDIEMNLYLDYRGERCWGVAQLEFDNNGGLDQNPYGCCEVDYEACPQLQLPAETQPIDEDGCHGSGTCDNIALRKAYMGYNVFECGHSRFDIEVGRRNLFHVFDSKVQFRSRMDGVLLRYSNSFDFVCDFYVNIGAWIVDENSKHYAYAGEIGLIDIYDTGFDFKYSFIDWSHSRGNRCNVREPWGMEFQTSQWYAAYNFTTEILRNSAKLYGALLWNHNAMKRPQTANHRDNFGWYVGFQVGDVKQEGDWHVDFNYQYLEAQVVMDCDVTGIGRGNVKGIPFTVNNSGGNVNYQGYRIEALYALTDNLSINPTFEWSREANDEIGGKHRYSRYELQLMYAF